MAILFAEGLPRSGKSYETMVKHIIPWLQKGREVVAYIEGLETVECQEKIAKVAGIPLERVQQLLFPLTREDMRPREEKRGGKLAQIDGLWIEKTRDNALHVYDEAQNWWPNRTKPSDALTQFVTEHGHRGITIVLMGQSLMDVLALWRRRVDQKFTYLKLSALGRDSNYRVTVYKGQGNDEFVKVGDKLNKYDPKYFGTYSSHVSTDTDTDTYTDNRVLVFKGAAFKYGVPLTIALGIWGAYNLWAYFHPKPVTAVAANGDLPLGFKPMWGGKGPPTVPTGATGERNAQGKGEAAPDNRTPAERYFGDLTQKGARVRLAGLLRSHDKLVGTVEWLDGNTRVIERVSIETLREVGVTVRVNRDTLLLEAGDWKTLVTMWPADESEGRVSQTRQEQIRGGGREARTDDAVAGTPLAPPGLMIIDGSKGSGVPAAPAAPLQQTPAQPRVPAGSKWSFQVGGGQ